MTIAVPEKHFLAVPRARWPGQIHVFILASTLLVVVADDKSAIALPFYHSASVVGIASRSDRKIITTVSDDKKFEIRNVSGLSGRSINIPVIIPDEILKMPNTSSEGPVFLMLEGMPAEINLSAGFRVKEKVWLLSLQQLRDLTLSAPPDYSGRFDVKAVLHRGKITKPLNTTFSVQISAPPAPAAQSILDSKQELALLDRAESLFRGGDLQSARLIFTELAGRGSRKAALRLAQSYDPQILKSLFIVGAEPNLEKALELYKRAAEMGVTEAQDRLNVVTKTDLR